MIAFVGLFNKLKSVCRPVKPIVVVCLAANFGHLTLLALKNFVLHGNIVEIHPESSP